MLVAVVILGFTDAIMFDVIVCPSAVTLLANIALINDDDDVPDDVAVIIDGVDETIIDWFDDEITGRFICGEYMVAGTFCCMDDGFRVAVWIFGRFVIWILSPLWFPLKTCCKIGAAVCGCCFKFKIQITFNGN